MKERARLSLTIEIFAVCVGLFYLVGSIIAGHGVGRIVGYGMFTVGEALWAINNARALKNSQIQDRQGRLWLLGTALGFCGLLIIWKGVL